MGEFGPWPLVIVAVVVEVLLGSRRPPEAARSLGCSLRIFTTEMNSLRDGDPRVPSATPAATVAPLPEPIPAQPGSTR